MDLSSFGVRTINNATSDIQINSLYKPDFKRHDLVNNQTNLDKKYGYHYKKGIGYFEMHEGKILDGVRICRDQEEYIRVLLNYPMGCLMYQKGFYVLHGSVVRVKGKTLLFCGPSGSGKSSISAALINTGSKLISEDTVVIDFNNSGEAIVKPSYPWIKLSEEVNQELSFSKKEGQIFKLETNQRRGHIIPLSKFDKERSIDYCFFLDWGNKTIIEEVENSSAFNLIMNSCLTIFPFSQEKEEQLFLFSTKLLNQTKNYKFSLTKDVSSLKTSCNKILDFLE